MELFQGVEMLAGADEFDGHARDGLHRQRRAAAGVAVELGHDHAVELQRLVEGLGAGDGILPRHSVDHQVDLVGIDTPVDQRELVHQFGVDVQAAGRIENCHVRPSFPGLTNSGQAEGDGIFGGKVGVDGQFKLLAEYLQLLDGGGALQVGGHQHRFAAALANRSPQLAAGGRFARALKTAEHQHRDIAAEVERMVHRPHQVHQFLIDDVNQLFGGVQRFQDRLADGLLADPGHEILDHRQADVGLQQGALHQAEAVAHVRLGKPSASAEGP